MDKKNKERLAKSGRSIKVDTYKAGEKSSDGATVGWRKHPENQGKFLLRLTISDDLSLRLTISILILLVAPSDDFDDFFSRRLQRGWQVELKSVFTRGRYNTTPMS